MKKWYQERFFSSRNWILDNLANLDINALQALILLLIDFYNEEKDVVTMELLVQQTHAKIEQIDKAIADLCKKEYLKISTKNKKVYYDISGLYEGKPKLELSKDLFETFETEFKRPLSQKETTTVAEWQLKYNDKTIIKALREAVLQNKINMNYIDRILDNWSKNDIS